MAKRFKGKIVLVNGGASGMGEEIVKLLVKAGAVVILADRNAERGSKLVAKLRRRGGAIAFHEVELLQEKQVEKLYADVLLKHKQIDYVFNIAGSFMAGEIRDTPLKNWHYILEEDTFAVVNGTHYAYQAMLTQGSGHIVNMGSSAGLFPVPTMGIYGASKYAIVGLTHALRIEAKALGIKASVICPIIVNTPLYDAAVYNSMDKKRFLKTRHFVQRPQTAAKRILKGVARNKATIHTSVLGQLGWRLVRYTPPLWDLIARGMIGGFRKTLRTK